MSLYGTGRREGVAATLILIAVTFATHLVGTQFTDGLWHRDASHLRAGLLLALTPALAGVAFYRFLRCIQRSRYCAFLGGAAYALSPWLCATVAMPREQLAAALAPIALEAACRTARPDDRKAWLPWAGLLIAVPFAAGITTVGLLVSTVATLRLLGATVELRRVPGERRYDLVLGALASGVLFGTGLVLIDPGQSWLWTASLPTTIEVLAAHRAPSDGLDLAALLRLCGPVLALFALLGLLRRQPHASRLGWTTLAVVGGVPTALAAWSPDLASLLDLLPRGAAAIPAASFWLTLVATTVLGTAGLDDFLELPMRRPRALPWLLGLTLVGSPLLLLTTPDPMREWPVTATLLAVALLLTVWKDIGTPRLKNVLAIVTVVGLLMPAIQVLGVHAEPALDLTPAAPFAEFLPAPPDGFWELIVEQPRWHFAGLYGAIAWALFGTWLVRRRTKVKPTPRAARPAIAKKAPPA